MSPAAQVLGAVLILSGFAGTQFRLLRANSYRYLALNFAGSAILAVLALDDRQWGFVLLESVWAVVSLWGIIARALGRATSPRE